MTTSFVNMVLARQVHKLQRKIQRRNIRDATNPFEYPEAEFQKLFRFNKVMVIYICEEHRSALQPINTHDGLPVHIKVLTCIRHLSDGSYQRGTGQDHSVCLGQTTVSKYLDQFTTAVLDILFPKWIIFPTREDGRRSVANGFRNKFGIPYVLGAIDCTQIAIFPPPQPHGIQFKNRKGYSSINVQLIVDVDCRILNINARYPGRTHDQFIFNNSAVKEEMVNLYRSRIGSYFLLGDSGYALEPWLMTSIMDALPNTPQDKYTKWHCQTRNCVERANGYIKGTFRCLGIDRVLHYDPVKCCKIIKTCATLYNMMIHYRVPLPALADHNSLPHPEENQIREVPNYGSQTYRLANNTRNELINVFFS